MDETFVRDGLSHVTPYLTLRDARTTVDFVIRVFDGILIEQTEDSAHKVSHATVRIGASTIEIAEASEQFGHFPAALHVYVPDVEETHRRAVSSGATVLHEPMDMDYGERASAVMDGAGNHWYIATYLGE